jgi:DNA-directed RNA polymerase subunit RPC12/RpoP
MTYKCLACNQIFEHPTKIIRTTPHYIQSKDDKIAYDTITVSSEIYVCPFCEEKTYHNLKPTPTPAKEAPP